MPLSPTRYHDLQSADLSARIESIAGCFAPTSPAADLLLEAAYRLSQLVDVKRGWMCPKCGSVYLSTPPTCTHCGYERPV